jgi:hypothetical protein
MNTAVIIPWRDRGVDPLRSANLHRVQEQWAEYDLPVIISGDGRDGDAPFNRSAAYNRGIAAATDAEVFILAESDMLIDIEQIAAAAVLAARAPGLVMPFRIYHALSPEHSERVRAGEVAPAEAVQGAGNDRTAAVHGGAINIISRTTYYAVGRYDEMFEGAWYDDDSMKRAFEICCGPTRFVDGPAYHLYHLPGGRGEHLRPGDRAATVRNKARHERYLLASTPGQIRALTMES